MVIEVNKSRWKEAAKLLKACMEGAWPAGKQMNNVLLAVKLRIGKNWGNMEDVTEPL